MGKVRTTEKELRNAYGIRIALPYCALSTITSFLSPAYYTAGAYGWNQDCYIIDENMLLCTGYRTIGKIPVSSDLIKEYDEKAKNARPLYPASITFDELRDYYEHLLKEICYRALNEYNAKKKK